MRKKVTAGLAGKPWEVLAELIKASERRQNTRRIKELGRNVLEVHRAYKRRETLRLMENSAGVPHANLDKEKPSSFHYFVKFRKEFERLPSDSERVEFVRAFLSEVFDGAQPLQYFRAHRYYEALCVTVAKSPYAREIFLAEGKERRKREQANERAWVRWLKSERRNLELQAKKQREANLTPAELRVLKASEELKKVRAQVRENSDTLGASEQEQRNAENRLLKLLRKTPAPETPERVKLPKVPKKSKWKPRTPEQNRRHRDNERERRARERVKPYLKSVRNLKQFQDSSEELFNP